MKENGIMKKVLLLAIALMCCVFCFASCNEETPKPHEHTWGDWQTTKEATCTEKGEEQRKCTGCDKTETQEIAAIGHVCEKTEALAATCTEDGNIEYYTCTECNKIFSDEACTTEVKLADTSIEKLGHDFSADEVLANDQNRKKAATCTAKAQYYKVCTRCKAFNDQCATFEHGEMAPHSYTKNEVLANDANKKGGTATCQTGATYYKVCSACKHFDPTAATAPTFEGPKVAHNYAREIVLAEDANLKSAATCTADAVYYKLCTMCDAFENGDSAATFAKAGTKLNHTATRVAILANDANMVPGSDAHYNCQHGKMYYKLCETCDHFDTTNEQFEGEKGAHVFTREVVLADNSNLRTPANCHHKATYWKVCANCDTFTTEEAEGNHFENGEAQDHSYTSEIILENDANLVPGSDTNLSCTKGKMYYKVCAGCNGFITTEGAETFEDESSRLPHTFIEGILPDGSNLKSAATCEDKAVYWKHCENCNALSTEEFFVDEKSVLLAHEGDEWVLNSAETAMVSTCKTCHQAICREIEKPTASADPFELTDTANEYGSYTINAKQATFTVNAPESGIYLIEVMGYAKAYTRIRNTTVGLKHDFVTSVNRPAATTDTYAEQAFTLYLQKGENTLVMTSASAVTLTKARFTLKIAGEYQGYACKTENGSALSAATFTPNPSNTEGRWQQSYVCQMRQGDTLAWTIEMGEGVYSTGIFMNGSDDTVLNIEVADSEGNAISTVTVQFSDLKKNALVSKHDGSSGPTNFIDLGKLVYIPAKGNYTVKISMTKGNYINIGGLAIAQMTVSDKVTLDTTTPAE